MHEVRIAVLTGKGFSSAVIDEILRTVGVPKGAFCHFFGSKEAFGEELIARYAIYFARKLDRFFSMRNAHRWLVEVLSVSMLNEV